MKVFARIFLSVALLIGTAATAFAAGVSLVPPDQSVAQIPVTQFKSGVPATLPSTSGHPAVGTVFAIQSYSSSQQTPVSPKPGVQVCVDNGQCSSQAACGNAATWPSVAQSISWWQSQNQNLKGTYAYQVGSTYSHQDAEGWINHCQPQPSCPGAAGWTGSYSWNGSGWVSGCSYHQQPSCPSGYTGGYSWNGSTWVDNCQKPQKKVWLYWWLPSASRGFCCYFGEQGAQVTAAQARCLESLTLPVQICTAWQHSRGATRCIAYKTVIEPYFQNGVAIENSWWPCYANAQCGVPESTPGGYCSNGRPSE